MASYDNLIDNSKQTIYTILFIYLYIYLFTVFILLRFCFEQAIFSPTNALIF